jgi:hypothetical protein
MKRPKRGRVQLSPEGRKPVGAYSETQLREFLVADAVKRHATHLPWAVAAYDRIGKLSRKGPEQAFVDVLDEVEALTGLRMMPVQPKVTEHDMKGFR